MLLFCHSFIKAHLMTPPVVLKHNHPLVPRSMEIVHRIAVSFKPVKIFIASTVLILFHFMSFSCRNGFVPIICMKLCRIQQVI